MPVKTVSMIEVEKNGRSYQFHLPADAPIGEVYDAAFSVLEEILAHSKRAAEAARPKEVKE